MEGRLEELDLDNIMTGDELENMFISENNLENPDNSGDNNEPDEGSKEKEVTTTEEDLTLDTLSGGQENPEGVGGGSDKDQEDPDKQKTKGNLPSNNVYSSIALALQEEGVLPNLNSEDVSGVNDATAFAEIIEKEVNSRFDEKQRRIAEALDAEVEVSKIQSYERTINQLNAVTDEALKDESEKGENLRKVLIYNDFINRGYSKERAERELKKSLDAGTDIDDAIEALQAAKQYYNDLYNSEIEDAKQAKQQHIEERKKQAEQLQKDILSSESMLDIKLEKTVRQKIYDSVSKPVYQDPDTKEYLTAIQKFQKEHPAEFLKYTGLFYTLTDGYKNIDKLVGEKVQKEQKKQFKKLEQALNSTSRNPDGSLRFMNGGGAGDKESSFKGFELDI